MRRIVPLLVALTAALCVVTAPSASAGGPTSVLIVNQSDGRAAAAYYQSSRYESLTATLGGEGLPTAATNPPAISEDAPPLRMVWLIHDVTPWRIDQVHVVGGAVWVQTFMVTGGGNPYDSKPVWHRPTRGAELLADLTALGVYGTSTAATGGSPASTAPQPAIAAEAPAATTGAPWLLVAVLVAGALALGVVADRRLSPRLTARRPVLAS